VFRIPQRAKTTAKITAKIVRRACSLYYPPFRKKPILRLYYRRRYRRFPRYFPIVESISLAASEVPILSDLLRDNPVIYEEYSLNPRLNTIQDRR
jgi:hypothetical protein